MPTNKTFIGIDLGTTRCCAAIYRSNGIVDIIPLGNTGDKLIPSYVSFDQKIGGEISSSTIFDIKRILGKQYTEIVKDNNWNFNIIKHKNRVKIQYESDTGFIEKYPEEISADLLKHINQKIGNDSVEVVITVPAAFNSEQKNATRAAALLAGFTNGIHLLSEPIAASFAHFSAAATNSEMIQKDSTFLLLDLGGGTLDVCIFKVSNNQLKEICKNGDPNLGGRNFDNLLIKYFSQELRDKFGINVPGNRKHEFLQEIQNIKHNLTEKTEDELSFIDEDNLTNKVSITQEDFEKLSIELLKTIEINIMTALENCKHTPNQINKVLYVGGGCRMPMIKKLLKSIFPQAQHCDKENPDEVVAKGAAYYAYYLNIPAKENYVNSSNNSSCSLM
uniref:Heat shock protein 70 n=1 Tax=Panagrolaimus sp. ES5 TaxID=591445 RepID=A0AC34FIG9_9BILA